ncbi:unnamed protein product [Staurois parvus]|uniref:Uncharacterized protein n=1 Tax=Staurois parvus TaxID=386267 RepID=A0ABN9EE31_9NEOB|nr:unnamed protein product [Staurois parvus]
MEGRKMNSGNRQKRGREISDIGQRDISSPYFTNNVVRYGRYGITLLYRDQALRDTGDSSIGCQIEFYFWSIHNIFFEDSGLFR